MRHAARALAACAVAAAAAAAQAAPSPAASTAPAPGLYDGQLCVTVAEAAPQCGAVDVAVDDAGALRAQFSDIVYRLTPWRIQLDVVLMHGTMQIDGFRTSFDWAASKLRFADPEKGTRYELQLGTRRPQLP